MAFRIHNPNTRAPSRSDKSTWRTVEVNKSVNREHLDSIEPTADASKQDLAVLHQEQEYSLPVVPTSSRLARYQGTQGQNHIAYDATPSNTATWSRANVLSPIGSRPSIPRISYFSQQQKVAQTPAPVEWNDSLFESHPSVGLESGIVHDQVHRHGAIFRPPMTDRTNVKRTESSQFDSVSSVKLFSSEDAPIESNRGYSVPGGFRSYSAAASSRLPATSERNAALPAFEIYKDYQAERNQETYHAEQNQEKHPPEKPKSLEEYSREIYSLSESCNRGSAQQAEFILRSIIFKFKNREHDVQPDGSCYNSVIHAFAKAGMPHQAENVMRLMFADYKNGNESAEPNVRCFTNVLHAWRKSRDPEAPERCEGLIEQMHEISNSSNMASCKPDTFAMTVLLHCWIESNRDDAAQRAEAHFRDMKTRFLNGDEGMRPDCISYSILLNMYAQKMQVETAERALWEMIDDFLDGNLAAEPRTRNFNTIMAMYSRSDVKDAPERAEELLARFSALCNEGHLRVHPDEYTYALLLKTWTTSDRSDGIETAVERLEWMRSLYHSGNESALPDVIKYSTVVAAYAHRGDTKNAAKILNRMIGDYGQGKDKRMKPDFALFDLVIKTSSGLSIVSGSAAFGAESILRSMWSLHESGVLSVRPHASTYKHIIVCFKKAGMPQRAEDFLWEMESKLVGKPYKTLFQTVLNSWHASRHPDKHSHISSLRLEMEHRFGREVEASQKSNKAKYCRDLK